MHKTLTLKCNRELHVNSEHNVLSKKIRVQYLNQMLYYLITYIHSTYKNEFVYFFLILFETMICVHTPMEKRNRLRIIWFFPGMEHNFIWFRCRLLQHRDTNQIGRTFLIL